MEQQNKASRETALVWAIPRGDVSEGLAAWVEGGGHTCVEGDAVTRDLSRGTKEQRKVNMDITAPRRGIAEFFPMLL